LHRIKAREIEKDREFGILNLSALTPEIDWKAWNYDSTHPIRETGKLDGVRRGQGGNEKQIIFAIHTISFKDQACDYFFCIRQSAVQHPLRHLSYLKENHLFEIACL